MTKARHDFKVIDNIGYIKIKSLNYNQFSIRNDRLKGLDELRIQIEQTGKVYHISAKDFEIIRHHKYYNTSKFGPINDYESWYYDVDRLREVRPNNAVGKTPLDLPMTTKDSNWKKGREVIADARDQTTSQ